MYRWSLHIILLIAAVTSHAAFGAGIDERHIATVDTNGVALAAIQGLNEKLEEKDAQIKKLTEPPLFFRPPVRPNSCFRSLPLKVNSWQPETPNAFLLYLLTELNDVTMTASLRAFPKLSYEEWLAKQPE